MINFSLKKAAASALSVITAISGITLCIPSSLMASAQTETLLNDTFEESYGSWKGVGASIERTTDKAYEGSYSLKCYNKEQSWGAPRCSVSKITEPGSSYGFSCYVYYDDTENGGDTQKFSMQYVYTDANGTERYGYIGDKQINAGEWTQITVSSHTIPSGAEGVTIYIQADKMCDYYIDNVTVTGEPVSSTEKEDGFENNFDKNSAEGWTGRGSASAELTTRYSHSGQYSMYVSGRQQLWNGAAANKDDVLTAGGYYSIGTYVYYDGDEWSDTQKFSINLQYDADGKENYYTIATETAKKGEWTYVGTELTVPSNGTNFFVYIQTGYTSAPTDQDLMNFYFDDVSAKRLPDPKIEDDLPSLKSIYENDFKIGCACTDSELENNAAKDLIKHHYNSLTLGNELKPDSTLDYSASVAYAEKTGDYTNPQITIKNAKNLLDFASENNIPVRGHVLVWHSQTPDWFFKEKYNADGDWVDKETMNLRMENYIKNIMQTLADEYPNIDFYAWDVVNEAASDSGTIRPAGSNNKVSGQSAWVSVYGDQSYIYNAFKYARKYAPEGCMLYYNDYNEYNPVKQDYIIKTIKELKLIENNLIDGIGMQSHISMSYPTIDLYREAIEKYADLGLDIQITELDVSLKSNAEEDQLSLAKRYRDIFSLYKEMSDKISAVVLWGITDSTSWIGGYPLLFDKNYSAKPAFYAVADLDSVIKEIKTVNAYYSDGSISDLSRAFEISKLQKIGNAGYFKAIWLDGNLVLRITSNEEGRYSVIGDEVSAAGEIKKGETAEIKINTEKAASDSSLRFDVMLNDTAWNDSENFSSSLESTGTLGKVNFISQPEYGEAVKGTAKIDGEIDAAWTKANVIKVSKFQAGANGASADARVMWDNDNIYVLMEVTDSLLCADSSNYYEQDCVEVFFDENNNKTSSYEEDDIQARVNYENLKTVTDGLSTDRFESAVKKTSSGYNVEIAIPSTLGGFVRNQIIGFDCQVNDDADGDGKRDNVSIWNDMTGMGYQDPSVFGIIKLTDSAGYEVGDVNNDGTTNKKDIEALQRFLLKKTDLIDFAAADLDGNKKIDIKDLSVLKGRI